MDGRMKISLDEIFDPNSKYIAELADTFMDRYGAEFDAMVRLSEKYGCAFVDIDPENLEECDVDDYWRAFTR